MKASKIWGKVGRLYDMVEAALWATLLGLVIFFTLYTLPHLAQFRSQKERVHTQETAVESGLYCEKLGIRLGSESYNECLTDLEEFRTKIKKGM